MAGPLKKIFFAASLIYYLQHGNYVIDVNSELGEHGKLSLQIDFFLNNYICNVKITFFPPQVF